MATRKDIPIDKTRFLESIISIAHSAKDEEGEDLRDSLDLIRGDISAIEAYLVKNEVQSNEEGDNGNRQKD